MERSRWIGLTVTALYVFAHIWPLGRGDASGSTSGDQQFTADAVGGLLAFLGFACTWWSDALGNALWIDRCGGAWNPKVSTEGAVKLLGYLFLIAAFGVHVLMPS